MAQTPEEKLKLLLSSGNLHTEQQIRFRQANGRAGIHHVLASETVESWAEKQPENTIYSYRTRYIITGQWEEWSESDATEGTQAP